MNTKSPKVTGNPADTFQLLMVRMMEAFELYFAIIAIADHISATSPEFAERAKVIKGGIERAGETIGSLEVITPSLPLAEVMNNIATAVNDFNDLIKAPLADIKQLQGEVLDLDKPLQITRERMESVTDKITELYTVAVNASSDINWRIKSIKEKFPHLFQQASAEIVTPTTVIGNFAIRTSQEADVFFRSGCNGKNGAGWRNELQRDVRVFEPPSATHRVEISRRTEDSDSLLTWPDIELLTKMQDRDSMLTSLYVLGIIAPTERLPDDRLAGGWIDLNDIMAKIGWLAAKPDADQREELRQRLWGHIQYGARAVVVGSRSTPYKNLTTGEELNTFIESAPWNIIDRRYPDQQILTGGEKPPPVAVYLAVSKQWEPLLSNPFLTQHYPLGELLGAIPPNKVGGDWARSIGLCLAREWRMRPQDTLSGDFNPNRRLILTHYAPKTKTVEEILDSKNPKRAVLYYCEALGILADAELIARVGDAEPKMTAEKMMAKYDRKGWANEWLSGNSGLRPGAKWEPAVAKAAKKVPHQIPKDLKLSQKRHRAFSKKKAHN